MTINVKEYLADFYPDEEDIIVFDGLDEAFIGVGYIFNKAFACYDREKIITILMVRDEMSVEEAEEFFDFNIAGSYCGDRTPILLEPLI